MPRNPRYRPLDDRIRCQHMLEAAQQILQFTTGRSRADLDADSMLLRATLHAMQEIGEAAAKVSDAGRNRVPGVPWQQVVGMRHRLVHDYWDVNRDLVWAVVERDLAPLIDALNDAFREWPMPELPEV